MTTNPRRTFVKLFMVGLLAATNWMLPSTTDARGPCPGGTCSICLTDCGDEHNLCLAGCDSDVFCIRACIRELNACRRGCTNSCPDC